MLLDIGPGEGPYRIESLILLLRAAGDGAGLLRTGVLAPPLNDDAGAPAREPPPGCHDARLAAAAAPPPSCGDDIVMSMSP